MSEFYFFFFEITVTLYMILIFFFFSCISTEVEPAKKPSPSPNQLVPTIKLADIKTDTDTEPDQPRQVQTDDVPSDSSSSDNTSKAASIDYINNDIPITPRSTPQVLLLQQLLQKQQQQIVILQKLQPNGPDGMSVVPTANTIGLSPSSGSAGVVLTVNTKVHTFVLVYLFVKPYLLNIVF